MNKLDIKSMTREALSQALADCVDQPFRIKQIEGWLRKGIQSFEEMENLPKTLRTRLSEIAFLSTARPIRKQVSNLDGTIKYLNELYDGSTVESVLMNYKHGYSICISTQVGCKMGCTFCATGQDGFTRDLLPGEMEGQIQAASADAGVRISNVVLMGMGEPLDNYKNVLRFFELIGDAGGLHIGMRHVSLSTCGIVDRMYDLAAENLQLTLSVSLHAPNDAIRSQTMPVNRRWNMTALLQACRYYTEKTHRRISFEYAMISGVNDSAAAAKELAVRLRGILAHVNLIPVNPTGGTAYRRSRRTQLEAFQRILAAAGFSCTVRRTLGADIEASCGQLKRRHKEETHEN